MDNRIQGITVEIGGDTTKLTTALRSVNTEIRVNVKTSAYPYNNAAAQRRGL